MTDPSPAGWSATERPGPPARTVTITDLLRIPLHRIRLVGGIAAAGLLAALTFVLLAPSAVTANAVVAVRPVVTDAFTPTGSSPDRAVNMNVESGIATGTDVVGRIATANGQSPRDVRNALEVEIPTGGQILRFVYRAPSVEEAVEMVNLAAQSYLDVRREMYEKQRTEMLRAYDENISNVTSQQRALQRRIDNADGRVSDATVSELSGINNQLGQLNSARSEIAAVDVNPGWVTQTAEPALASRDGNRMLFLVAGLLGGTLVGVVVAYAWESMDRRVRSVTDGREVTGLPLLGTVRRRRVPPGRGQPVDADVRYVAMAIAAQVRPPARVAVLTAREDPTTTTAGLAVALAADGRPVFVADDSGRAGRLRDAVVAGRSRLPLDRPGATIDGSAVQGRSPVALGRPGTVPKPRPGGASTSGSVPVAGASGAVPVPTANPTPGPTAGRRPSPYPVGARPSSDPEATVTLPRVSSKRDGEYGRTVDAEDIAVGSGTVRIGTARQGVGQPLVLYNAPPAESDERGVALARQGTAVVVVERDRTRQADLRRLVERLRAAGVTPLGFVLTRNGHG
ncbi:lipopolysaccharide biosynthesis protein [Micromonospora fluostatini]